MRGLSVDKDRVSGGGVGWGCGETKVENSWGESRETCRGGKLLTVPKRTATAVSILTMEKYIFEESKWVLSDVMTL